MQPTEQEATQTATKVTEDKVLGNVRSAFLAACTRRSNTSNKQHCRQYRHLCLRDLLHPHQ